MPDEPEPGNSYNLAYLEQLYADYTQDPQQVPADYRDYFAQLATTNGNGRAYQTGPKFRRPSIFRSTMPATASAPPSSKEAVLQERVAQLIRNFRVRGHTMAKVDPLNRPRPESPDLNPFHLGFTEEELDQSFSTAYIGGPKVQTLREIIWRLHETYCRSIGAQFMHINDLDVRTWLQDRMESTENYLSFSRDDQFRILKRLTDAVVFEEFLQKKYIGAKTFSLEGAETLIPLLDLAIEHAGEQDVDEIVIGMAHRGRLNVLSNILGKRPVAIFREFEDRDPRRYLGGGDVKYHLGYSSDWKTKHGHNVHLSLCFNPSHLEYINPVAAGRTRAKQDRAGDTQRRRGLAVIIHGDAAIAGEGVVQETLNMSELPAYTIGGTLHIVVNNQVGFTTLPAQARSSMYATDIARMLQVPIFHVNGEDPEAVGQVVRLAMDFRAKFQRDVFIDMYCYRRRGHNEGDEPAFTQPLMYQTIEQRKSVRESYLDRLLRLGEITQEEVDVLVNYRTAELEKALEEARGDKKIEPQKPMQGVWKNYIGGAELEAPDPETGVAKETLSDLLMNMTNLPEDFNPHPKVMRNISKRQKMAAGEESLDWATAESLAFASLAVQGHRVRMTGQDVERGTFSQRHTVLHDIEDGHTYEILNHLSEEQATVEIANSSLSENGVLGFEYGYSLDCPEGLIIWEAQFGDFVNSAQVIIDQFIASAEDKWRRLSGVVMLLPHGFEGQGPEHSSARMERFLVLSAEDNMQVVNTTTPAQYFHLLRRQVVRPWRKPLVVFTPKSLLRHPKCVSTLDEMGSGRFERVLADPRSIEPEKVKRILLCTGKIYYELDAHREEIEANDVAIVRLEQLYPFPDKQLCEVLSPYPNDTPVYWVQEEPRNMGAWPYLRAKLGYQLYDRLPFHGIARAESASPATGSPGAHRIEQEELIQEAFGGSKA